MLLLITPLFIGTTELIIIGGIALLLFGGKKLPEIMHGLGQGIKEFKKGINNIDEAANERKQQIKKDQPMNNHSEQDDQLTDNSSNKDCQNL